MAGAPREIPRSEWRPYFDDFSRTLGAVRARVEVAGLDLGSQVEAERLRLTAITYDDGDDILVVGLDAPGGLPEDLEHIVDGPLRIHVADGDDGTTHFEVEGADGTRTLIHLAPAE